MCRYAIAGGQHYYAAVLHAIGKKPYLGSHHSNISHLSGEIYALGWLKQFHENPNKLETLADRVKEIPIANGEPLTDAELLQLPALTVKVAKAFLVREHQDVADLHTKTTQEEMVRYMRKVWLRGANRATDPWQTMEDIGEEDLVQIETFTGLKSMLTLEKKLAIAVTSEDNWNLVESLWRMHKYYELLDSVPPGKKGKKKPEDVRHVNPNPLNIKVLEEIFALPSPTLIPYALRQLVNRHWKLKEAMKKCGELRSVANLTNIFVDTVTWNFQARRRHLGVDKSWAALQKLIPKHTTTDRLWYVAYIYRFQHACLQVK